MRGNEREGEGRRGNERERMARGKRRRGGEVEMCVEVERWREYEDLWMGGCVAT